MLSDPIPQAAYKSPKELGGTSVGVLLYVEDMFWGDRFGTIADPFGHAWQLATHKEDLTPEVMAERAKEAMASMS